MYMALTEEQAKEIRKLGISVIEWKRCMRNNVNVAIYAINKAKEKIAQVWKKIVDALDYFIDKVALIVEEINDRFHLPTSRRYKFVKIINAMGYDKHRVWAMTRHTWFARSNC